MFSPLFWTLSMWRSCGTSEMDIFLQCGFSPDPPSTFPTIALCRLIVWETAGQYKTRSQQESTWRFRERQRPPQIVVGSAGDWLRNGDARNPKEIKFYHTHRSSSFFSFFFLPERKSFWFRVLAPTAELLELVLSSAGHGRGRLLHYGKPAEVSQGSVWRITLQRSVPVQGSARISVYGGWIWDAGFPRWSGDGLAGLGQAGSAQHAPQSLALQQQFTHRLPLASVHGRPHAVHQQVRRALLPELTHHHRGGALESLRERPQLQTRGIKRQNERRICRSVRWVGVLLQRSKLNLTPFSGGYITLT